MKNSKNLSVCMLVTNIDASSGGIQKNSRILIKEFTKCGIKTYVCARNYHKLPRNEVKEGTVFRRSPVFGDSMVINSLLYLFDTFLWLLRNRNYYDIIYCQQMYAPAMIAALTKMFIYKPIVVRVTGTGELGEVKGVKKLPLVSTRLKLLKKIDKFVALTAEMKSEIETLDIPSKKIKIINNATDIPAQVAFDSETKNNIRQQLNLESDKIAVFVGRLSEEKGLDTLINAWKLVQEKHPSAQLFLLGEGGKYRNVEKQLRELSKILNLDNYVHFLGHVDNVKDYIMASNIFILPTRTEGMSNSLVEAFACGATIIASNIPANREICINDDNCLMFEVDRTEELAKQIIEIFSNPTLAQLIGKNARTFAEKNLSTEVMVSKYIKLYKEVLNEY